MPDIIETPEVQPDVVVKETPEVKPAVKQARKANRWVEHCTEVRTREVNAGKSYREILKIAKQDYNQ